MIHSSKAADTVAEARSARASQGIVRLLAEPRRVPATPEEECAVAFLAREGPQALHRLVDRMARDAYRDEVRRGGWAVDIGVLGSAPFRSEASRAVAAGAGFLWIIDGTKRGA